MRGVKFLYGGALFFFFFVALAYLGMQALVLEKSFLVAQKRAIVEDLVARKEKLAAEVAELSSLERIRAIATERLGMVPAERVVYAVVGKEILGKGEGETYVVQQVEREGGER
ncbi:MAG: septum formation initiator family protein [Candidatus Caldatribacterium sp.]|uniref:septum formation initiator family protein n=1 Tax=Candidatus Caldatribacterium sp. TaxID=2282143 RepID=UPI00299B749F|nr:septum formation initiator family protein [Candidatus Caldatribacterium sp.]MCX7729919.1 septum formation initiator family protein [Candidatus Caldatribacterium sp.]MDW8080444.1 septum formation initiator family protein [Candidatus Calescibacterium sp.]